MNDYFYSLGMLITGRGKADHQTLSAMDLLEEAIADEEKPPHPLIEKMIPLWRKSNEKA